LIATTHTPLAVGLALGEIVQVSLDRRIIGKSEEGATGLADGHSFSADICLIVSARRNGKSLAQRATLLQAKRLSLARHREFFRVDLAQVKDLAQQSQSSFLILIGPQTGETTIPIIPVCLALDWFDPPIGERTVRPDVAARLGRSLADWLLTDVIGMWTGDSSKDLIEKARGSAFGRPTTVLEMTVEIVSAPRRRD
jgi:hypothetical protein